MKSRFWLAAILSLLLFSGQAMAETGAWHTDWESAAAESEKSGKPILIDFTGSDWCGWCIRLKEEVFDTTAFQDWAKDNVVLLEIDFPRGVEQSDEVRAQNRDLAYKYDIEGFPTIIFSNSEGKELGRYGYDRGGPSVWTKKAEAYLK